MRRLGFILLMLMAAVAVGVTGAAPVWPRNRERHIEIEVVVEAEDDGLNCDSLDSFDLNER